MANNRHEKLDSHIAWLQKIAKENPQIGKEVYFYRENSGRKSDYRSDHGRHHASNLVVWPAESSSIRQRSRGSYRF
ncbi:MAG: hypothetical protein UW14_C0009G0026 [Candidatus Yanofskybacteria bacterium GW2011_GWA2_44_10]|nr:MAG: hypothetical protein UW14_C0009G0026 [Candidatus Yanofskybacteria bacterium GW2011_GWA2_44_10]